MSGLQANGCGSSDWQTRDSMHGHDGRHPRHPWAAAAGAAPGTNSHCTSQNPMQLPPLASGKAGTDSTCLLSPGSLILVPHILPQSQTLHPPGAAAPAAVAAPQDADGFAKHAACCVFSSQTQLHSCFEAHVQATCKGQGVLQPGMPACHAGCKLHPARDELAGKQALVWYRHFIVRVASQG